MIYDTRKFQSDVPERRSLESGILPGSRPTWTISSVNTPITGPTESSASCPFGEIIPVDDETSYTKGIRGGIIHCGDQNWNIDYQGLTLAADRTTWLVSISVSCEVNRDDDGDLLLPGVKTGTRPSGDWTKTAWTVGKDYPDNTDPVASTGKGTVILPIGKLTIANGVATLEAAGCGHFTITHCAGSLGYTRG